MKLAMRAIGVVMALAAVAGAADEPWWQRGADRWYYKDDWKGMAIGGGRGTVSRTIAVPGGAAGGWIVVWGDRGYHLTVNGKTVGDNIDGGLIDDYDLGQFVRSSERVVIGIGGGEVCAEGEIVGADGKRYAFATGQDWTADRGTPVRARKMALGPSTGAFHRAHNGRLMTYNDEERGKTAIAKTLARIQKLNEQGIFLMKRLRPAEQIVRFDENDPWRRAEPIADSLIQRARPIIEDAINQQKAGRFGAAARAAQQAGELIAAAEAAVDATTALYRAQRRAMHLQNWAGIINTPMPDDFAELTRSLALAYEAHALSDWATVNKSTDRFHRTADDVARRIEAAANAKLGRLAGGLGELDEQPEARFGWLNARELIGNDPVNWPFVVGPSDAAYLDLAGMWDFQVDPDGVGERQDWARRGGQRWRKLFVPRPWERQGIQDDNRKASNPPVITNDRFRNTTGEDKPYNGWGWYRREVFVPAEWKGRPVAMSCGVIANWGRVFVNGRGLDPITRPGEQRGVVPSSTVRIPDDALRFGETNTFAIQVYNHDNFGGIVQGEVALYVETDRPSAVQTPLPMGYATELEYGRGRQRTRYSILCSAMSPGAVVATDGNKIELWGWERSGQALPTEVEFPTGGGMKRATLSRGNRLLAPPETFAGGWMVIRGPAANVVVVPDGAPREILWRANAQGSMGFEIKFASAPARLAVVCLPPDARLDESRCRHWQTALRSYPVAASECVLAERPGLQRHLIRYSYLRMEHQGEANATVAPLPMLASFALQHQYPSLAAPDTPQTGYRSQHAAYRVKDNSDTVEYRAAPVDRDKVIKGAGELFARKRAADNLHGGLGEVEMFRRFAEWGFDHCRYALAFDADWDLPMVRNRTRITDDPAIWKRLDELVANCNNAGVQMMLCWFPEIGTRRWKDNPDWEAATLEWWRRAAQRYAHLPDWAISYDPFNEPAYMNTDHWNDLMHKLTRSIRSVDKRHMIVWESADGWAQPHWCLWMKPVDDPNVIYSFHHYGKHWGYAYDEYYPGYRNTRERTQIDPWLEAMLFGIQHHVPIHCGEFGISMIQPGRDGEAWLEDYLAFFERFGIGWNWWNYDGGNIYRTGLAAGEKISPFVPILSKWAKRSGWGKARGVSPR